MQREDIQPYDAPECNSGPPRGLTDAGAGVDYVEMREFLGSCGAEKAAGAELVAEVPVHAGADLGVSLLIGAAVGELGDEVMGHDA